MSLSVSLTAARIPTGDMVFVRKAEAECEKCHRKKIKTDGRLSEDRIPSLKLTLEARLLELGWSVRSGGLKVRPVVHCDRCLEK